MEKAARFDAQKKVERADAAAAKAENEAGETDKLAKITGIKLPF